MKDYTIYLIAVILVAEIAIMFTIIVSLLKQILEAT